MKSRWSKKKKDITLSFEEALAKLEYYCAYQERCLKDVRERLAEYGIYDMAADDLIALLEAGEYLDQARFVGSFVRGKFSLKRWGRHKIRKGLLAKGISHAEINIGLKEIEVDAYWNMLLYLSEQKMDTLVDEDIFVRKTKTARYLAQKGYESNLIWKAIEEITT